jgi:hypothetical protein
MRSLSKFNIDRYYPVLEAHTFKTVFIPLSVPVCVVVIHQNVQSQRKWGKKNERILGSQSMAATLSKQRAHHGRALALLRPSNQVYAFVCDVFLFKVAIIERKLS